MKTITVRDQKKTLIINSFRTLKEYFNIHSNKEENLQKIIQQLAETIVNSEYSCIDPENTMHQMKYLMRNEIKKQKEKALYDFLLHRGTLS